MAKIHAVNGEADKITKMEQLSRATPETHKLDLMAEISNLKLRLATSEKLRLDLQEKCDKSQKKAEDMQVKLEERAVELTELRTKDGKNGIIPAGPETDWQIRTLEREKTLDRLKRKHNEVERLKKAVESLMLANNEKDRCIEDLRKNVKRYQKMEEVFLTTHGKKAVEFDDMEDPSDNSSTLTSPPSANNTVKEVKQSDRLTGKENGHSFQPSLMPQPMATSTPVNSYAESPANNNNYSPTCTFNIPSPKSRLIRPRSNSCEDIAHIPHKSSPTSKHHGQGYFTPLCSNTNKEDKDIRAEPSSPQKNKVRTIIGMDEENTTANVAQQSKAMTTKKKSKGFKRFFGRLRRSNSQDFEDDFPGEFKRNGLRATAGPRLGWSKDVVNNGSDLDAPFARWDGDRVAVWMHSVGLSMYVGSCKRWVKNGTQLLNASSHELEKEMNMRSALHRKKLQLALKSVTSDTHSKLDDLDHNWVTRWLDDIGLSQYKDFFSDACVDGRMLHFLTVDELLALKVSNELHHISLKRAIQVLRMNEFDPHCLKRRPAPDEGQLNNAPNEVILWTNHRVMEWLRTIDLSEYAPNLRGSGVHGALMVLEPRFSSETLAGILSIPHSKTLLRRHLHTHFVTLLGSDTQATKRDYKTSNNYLPLTPNAKVKAARRLFQKRSKCDVDFVCPMDLAGSGIPFSKANSQSPTLSREEEKERAV